MARALLSGCRRYNTCDLKTVPLDHASARRQPALFCCVPYHKLYQPFLLQVVTVGWLTSGHPGMHANSHEFKITENSITQGACSLGACTAMFGAQWTMYTLCRRMLRQTLLWTEAKPWQEAPDFRTVTPRQVPSSL